MTTWIGEASGETLFSPLALRGVILRNRIVISPMCMYSGLDGMASDFHLAHYGRFGLGGAGLVMVEATSVMPQGCITHGDLGLWNDAQIAPLKRIVDLIKSQGAAVGIQLVHGGRKACRQRPWHGNGAVRVDNARPGEDPWPIAAASSIPVGPGYQTPEALDAKGIARVREAFRAATRRAAQAGFDVVELHAAHGFLPHGFMCPITNQRDDGYNGGFEARHRLAFELVEDMRSVWPDDRALFTRLSLEDGVEGGRTFDETLLFAAGLRERGVDAVDCSSGGIGGHSASTSSRSAHGFGFNVPATARVRNEAGVKTVAVGWITEPELANRVVANGHSDLVAIGRQALVDPNWPLHARTALGFADDAGFAHWPEQYGWWLERREPILRRLQAAQDDAHDAAVPGRCRDAYAGRG